MSIDHVSRVLGLPSTVSGTDRMVLFVLAEAANQDTDECWPSTATVAKRAGLRQDRYVTKAVAALVASGLIEVDPNGCPDVRIRSDRRPNLYRMVGVMAVRDGGARRAGSQDTGVRDALDGGARRASTGVRDAQSSLHIEPEVEPEVEPEASRGDAAALCEILAESIGHRGLRPNPTASWANDMRLLLERDGRTVEAVEKVIRWLDAGSDRVALFWQPNIRSPRKLREKWDQMANQYANEKKSAAPKPGANIDERRDEPSGAISFRGDGTVERSA